MLALHQNALYNDRIQLWYVCWLKRYRSAAWHQHTIMSIYAVPLKNIHLFEYVKTRYPFKIRRLLQG